MNDLRVAAAPNACAGLPGTAVRAAAVRLWVAALVGAALSGCATLENGTSEEFYVLSEPSGANVTTAYGNCVTPCKLDVNRKDEFTVWFEKAGYEPQNVKVESRSTAPESATSHDVTADYLGRVVDFQAGAQFVHVPNPVNVKLTKTPSPEG